MKDWMTKSYLIAWLGVYIIMLIGNHATKCGDALMYDITLVMLIFLGVIIWSIAYENI